MKALVAIVVVGVIVAGSGFGIAGEIEKREKREQNRINQGVKSGALTPKETERLEGQQKVIDEERAQAAKDGKITKRERQDIAHDQNRLSKEIHSKKHNRRRVYQ